MTGNNYNSFGGDQINLTGDNNIGKVVHGGNAPDSRSRPPGASAPRDPHRAGDPTAGPESFTAREVQELARVLGGGTDARQVLVEAGLPAARIPLHGTDAASFWREVSARLGDGVLHDGRRQILEAAARRYPANPVFLGGLR